MALRKALLASAGYRWTVLSLVACGSFMVNVDSSIVNVALPALQQSFHVRPAQLQWVVSAYLLVITGILPAIGQLADLRGRKSVFISGLTVFSLGSLLCANADSMAQLIIFRIIQSIGGAMIMANGISIITDVFPMRQRGRALGIVGSMVAIGTMVGPAAGGMLLARWGWPSIFWINIPIGLLGAGLAAILLQPKTVTEKPQKFDRIGAVIFFCAMVALILFISNGHQWGWTSISSVLSLGVALLAGVGFVWWERRFSSPLIDLGLFKNPVLSLGAVSAYIYFIIVMFPAFLLPLFLHRVLALSFPQIGWLMTAPAAATIVTAPLGGWLTDHYGYNRPAIIGMSVATIGLLLMAQFTAQTGNTAIVTALVLFGAGMGLFSSPNNTAMLHNVPIEKTGSTGSMIATIRNFGRVSGVALAVFLLESALDKQDADLSFNAAVSMVLYVGALLGLSVVVLSLLRSKSQPAK
ncbi:MAG TPA: MFS transporter [Acidiferrobacterales bacterium]|nr:MFS transporter [Acidiferrobacterales bacterium]